MLRLRGPGTCRCALRVVHEGVQRGGDPALCSQRQRHLQPVSIGLT